MTMRVLSQTAFMLHTRPYHDSSLLVDLFTKQHGRLRAIARGARGPRSSFRSTLRSFTPLVVNWSGRSELVNLTQAEGVGMPYLLEGKQLLCGFYVNELLLKLIPIYDPHAGLFDAYQQLLLNLQDSAPTSLSELRYFEKKLLEEIGYGLQLNITADHQNIEFKKYYHFFPGTGFLLADTDTGKHLFSGKDLLAFHNECLHCPEEQQAAKQLMRLAIDHLLNGKKLKVREVWGVVN